MAVENKAFWQSRWQEKNTPWDCGRAHPQIETLFGARQNLPPQSHLLVPGCGSAHDAHWLSEQGFHVTALDFVEEAIDRAKELYGQDPHIQFLCADFLDPSLSSRLDPFDGICDRAMLCALDPSKRKAYFQSVRSLLRKGGLFFATLFSEIDYSEVDHRGPPFFITDEELISCMGLPKPEILWQKSEPDLDPQSMLKKLKLVCIKF